MPTPSSIVCLFIFALFFCSFAQQQIYVTNNATGLSCTQADPCSLDDAFFNAEEKGIRKFM
jgi:hypothetical protein